MSGSKADFYRTEGEKALNRTLIFGFGKQQKYDDASDNFTKAGNAYKLANQWQSAGDMFLKASDAYVQADSANDATNALVEAANCYKKINPNDAVNTLKRAIDMFNDAGRFSMSARYYKELAEIYEADHNLEGAMWAYEKAAEFLNNDNKKSNANQCLLKVATICTDLNGDYRRAADIYESIGKESMTSRLGVYSAKGYFFQCLLCHLALGDTVAVNMKMEEYKNIDYSFGGSRECQFVEKLVEATNNMSEEDFSQACADFDRISPLDPWKTSVLLKAKHHIVQANDAEPDLS
eukprot:gene10048-13508_t